MLHFHPPSSYYPQDMSSHSYFPNNEHHLNGHHICGDDRDSTNAFIFENCFQPIPPSNSINRKSSSQRSWNTPFAPNFQHFVSPPIGNNLPCGVTHLSENSYNIQNTRISNFGNIRGNVVMPSKAPRRPSTKKAKAQRMAAHKVQDEDDDSEEASTTSEFDEAFSISNRGRRRSRHAKPHMLLRSISPPDPQPTRYLSVPPMTYSPLMTSYDPFAGFGAVSSLPYLRISFNSLTH